MGAVDRNGASGPSRRDLLGAAALAGLAGAVAGPAVASGGHSGAQARWDRALAAHKAAEAEADHHQASTYRPAEAACERITGPRPSLSFTVGALSGRSATYDMVPGNLDEYCASPIWKPIASPIRDRWREYQTRVAEAERRHGFRAIEAKQEALDLAALEARWALVSTPAPNVAALLVKLPIALECGDEAEGAREALLADVGRLA